jgi:hypothetical protein
MSYRPAALLIAALAVSVVAPRVPPARAQRPQEAAKASSPHQEKASLWMRHKLESSQKILEGMTRGDFQVIEKNATSMQTMSYLEGWVRADTPDYQAQLHAFEHATGSLVRAAQEKNLDGATLAYTQLTISCVQCHRVVRGSAK